MLAPYATTLDKRLVLFFNRQAKQSQKVDDE